MEDSTDCCSIQREIIVCCRNKEVAKVGDSIGCDSIQSEIIVCCSNQ